MVAPLEHVPYASIGFVAMGILDDAIREHIELKRKHGAAEDELQRQEEEALGPARREVAPTQTQDGNGSTEPAAEEPPAEASEAEASVAPPATVEPEAEPEPEPEAAPAPASPEPQVPFDAAQLEPEPRLVEPEPPAAEPEPPAAELEPDPPAPDEPRRPEGDTPPRGFEALEDHDDEPFAPETEPEDADDDEESQDDDVLQDTPDFLQETPEHDRLWFEQKPPRDFDFD